MSGRRELFERWAASDAAIRAMLAHPRVLTSFRRLLACEATRRDVLELLRDDRSRAVRAQSERRLSVFG